MAYDFNYKPGGAVLRAFLLNTSFFSGLRGPWGSGKSVACCAKLFYEALKQKRQDDGVRRLRTAVIRNTGPQLKTTTMKTWTDWFPEHIFGSINWSIPFTQNIRIAGELEWEVIFLALDRSEDVKKLLSLELTNAWANEAREIEKDNIDGLTGRVNRYPAKKDGGVSRPFVIADTNAPSEDHWWPIMSGETPAPEYLTAEERLTLVKPENWEFFTQPAAMVECKDEGGGLTGYELSPKAENINNLNDGYYQQTVQGKSRRWIAVNILNKLGSDKDGKVVYPDFRRDSHVARDKIEPVPGVDVHVGVDFGLTPAAAIAQKLPSGRWLTLAELVAGDMGAERFAPILKMRLLELGFERIGCAIKFWGDPSGDYRAQTDENTPFLIFQAQGIPIMPAPSNDPVIRIGAQESVLNRMVAGESGELIDPSCTILIRGYEDGYHYRRIQVSGEARYDSSPNKNRFSHIHDANQYAKLGGGEGFKLIQSKTGQIKSTQANTSFNPLHRAVGRRTRRGGWARLPGSSRL